MLMKIVFYHNVLTLTCTAVGLFTLHHHCSTANAQLLQYISWRFSRRLEFKIGVIGDGSVVEEAVADVHS